MANADRFGYTVLGYNIGTVTAYSLFSDGSHVLHDFEPGLGVNLPVAYRMDVNLKTGTFTSYNKQNKVIGKMNVVGVLYKAFNPDQSAM